MPRKIKIQLLELEALADVIGKPYGSLRAKVAELVKKGLPLEFGENGKYKLIHSTKKQWFAYDSTRYDIEIVSGPPKPAEPISEPPEAQNE